MRTSSSPADTASSTTYWIAGLSTTGSISLGVALVAGRNRVPRPAAGITALTTSGPSSMRLPKLSRSRASLMWISHPGGRGLLPAHRVDGAVAATVRPRFVATESERYPVPVSSRPRRSGQIDHSTGLRDRRRARFRRTGQAPPVPTCVLGHVERSIDGAHQLGRGPAVIGERRHADRDGHRAGVAGGPERLPAHRLDDPGGDRGGSLGP